MLYSTKITQKVPYTSKKLPKLLNKHESNYLPRPMLQEDHSLLVLLQLSRILEQVSYNVHTCHHANKSSICQQVFSTFWTFLPELYKPRFSSVLRKSSFSQKIVNEQNKSDSSFFRRKSKHTNIFKSVL